MQPVHVMLNLGMLNLLQWTYFDFKGDVEEILAAGRVKVEYVRSERSWLHPGRSEKI